MEGHEEFRRQPHPGAGSRPGPALQSIEDGSLRFHRRGAWTEGEYLALDTNQLVELSNGCLEILPLPTTTHQLIVGSFYRALVAHVQPRKLGTVVVAPLRVRLWEGKFREPDVVFLNSDHASRMGETYWDGADLVMEVVSQESSTRDLETKRAEYAKAAIPEYWIVEPEAGSVSVLRLEAGQYVLHARADRAGHAHSALLPDFAVAGGDLLRGT